MGNVYYDANNDMLYNTAMEVSTNTKARIGGYLGGMKFGIIEPIRRFVDTVISLIGRAIALTVPNNKVIWVSKEFMNMMNDKRIRTTMSYYKIVRDSETMINMVSLATAMEKRLTTIMDNIRIAFKKSDETPYKVTMGEFKKNAGVIMKYFKNLKTSIGITVVATKELFHTMKDDPEVSAEYKATTDSLKAIYKCAAIINKTIVKTLISAMFLAKKDDEKQKDNKVDVISQDS